MGRCRGAVGAGDIVCVIPSCAMPMVLRPIEGHNKVLGKAYLAGIMHGEAMTALHKGKIALHVTRKVLKAAPQAAPL